MGSPQDKMEEFLAAIVQGKTSVSSVEFRDSKIVLKTEGIGQVEVSLGKYACNVRKDFIQKLRLANISSLPIDLITIESKDYDKYMRGRSAKLPPKHVYLTEDIAEIIKALQSTPIAEASNVVGEGESQNGLAECNLMVETVSSTHQIDLNNRTLTDIRIVGELPPHMLKPVCDLIAAPGSTVKSVTVKSFTMPFIGTHDEMLLCRLLEEMLSAQKKGGSCPALESLTFHAKGPVLSGTSVECLGEFLQRTPSIKEIFFIDMFVEGSVAEKLAEVLCLNNQVHALQISDEYNVVTNLEEAVMRVLMRDSQGQHPITALNCLRLPYAKNLKKSLLCEFIKTTKCLTDLRLVAIGEAPELEVIEALKFNHGLEHFTWVDNYNTGSKEDVVFSAVMDALRVNFQLKDFMYPWKNNHYAEALTMLFEERATNKPWEVMKDMVLDPPTSARLFFCGYPHAGKTTLKNTIVKSLREKMEERGSPSQKRKKNPQ